MIGGEFEEEGVIGEDGIAGKGGDIGLFLGEVRGTLAPS